MTTSARIPSTAARLAGVAGEAVRASCRVDVAAPA